MWSHKILEASPPLVTHCDKGWGHFVDPIPPPHLILEAIYGWPQSNKITGYLVPERAPGLVEPGLALLYGGRLRVLHVDELPRQLVHDGHAGRVRVHLLVETVVTG